MVTVVLAETAIVVTVKVAVVRPEAIVTLAGTVATGGLLLVSVRTAPPAGAIELKVTVPVEVRLPAKLVGFKLKPDSVGGITAKLAF